MNMRSNTLPLMAAAIFAGALGDLGVEEVNGAPQRPRRDPLLDLADRQERDAKRKAGAAKFREERLARKRAAFEKRNPSTPR